MVAKTWIASSGTWTTGSNWNPSGAPGATDQTDTAALSASNSGAYTVSANFTGTIAALSVSNANATLSFTAAHLTVTGPTTLTAGSLGFSSAAGHLTTSTYNQTGGIYAGNRGGLSVTGAGATFSVSAGAFTEAASASV